jgi:GH35 family endo-1,4-beta-xylanase
VSVVVVELETKNCVLLHRVPKVFRKQDELPFLDQFDLLCGMASPLHGELRFGITAYNSFPNTDGDPFQVKLSSAINSAPEVLIVVNEAFKRQIGGLTDCKWQRKYGDDWIKAAFQTAADIRDMGATDLIINDFNPWGPFKWYGSPFGSMGILPYVQMMLDEGIPIDGIGIQIHIRPQDFGDCSRLERLIDAIHDLGLKAYIPELTISGAEGFDRQAQVAESILGAVASKVCMVGWTVYSDQWDWGPPHWKLANPKSGLLDEQLNPKPIFDVFKQYCHGQ